jgi:hypothetical protein
MKLKGQYRRSFKSGQPFPDHAVSSPEIRPVRMVASLCKYHSGLVSFSTYNSPNLATTASAHVPYSLSQVRRQQLECQISIRMFVTDWQPRYIVTYVFVWTVAPYALAWATDPTEVSGPSKSTLPVQKQTLANTFANNCPRLSNAARLDFPRSYSFIKQNSLFEQHCLARSDWVCTNWYY